MKNMLIYFTITLTVLIIGACGGGTSGVGSTHTPATTYTLGFISNSNGTLSGTTNQTVDQGANSASVIAVPVSGYRFVNWAEEGNVISTNATLSVSNVGSNHIYTANFAVNTQPPTTAILKMSLTGTPPASTGIAGTSFTLSLPSNVTPALTNGAVATGVVSLSGTFTNSIISPQAVYTAASSTTSGSLNVTLASSLIDGVAQAGEVATITLQLANGITPTVNSFGVNAISVTDAVLYSTISEMGAIVASVTLQ